MNNGLLIALVVTLMLVGLALMTYSGAYLVAEWLR